VITERKLAANRRNARASTGPRTAAGKARVAQNARRHGLNVAVADDPLLARKAAELTRAILDGPPNGGGAASAELACLARRVAEAHVDVMRVRRIRHDMIAGALADPRYRSPRRLRRHIAMLGRIVELLRRGIPVPDDMRRAAFGRPQGALKFALILADMADQLARLDRYERRALSRRKAAARDFDAARAGRGAPIIVPGFGPHQCRGRAAPPDPATRQRAVRAVRRWRNKPTATLPSGRNSTLPPRPWGDKPMHQVSYREAAAHVCRLLNIEWPLRTEGARDGPQAPQSSPRPGERACPDLIGGRPSRRVRPLTGPTTGFAREAEGRATSPDPVARAPHLDLLPANGGGEGEVPRRAPLPRVRRCGEQGDRLCASANLGYGVPWISSPTMPGRSCW
jgi:hypothetical protein